MAKKIVELVSHTFRGGRFDDHCLDVDVLPELVAYKTILVETAKELWRGNNPGRQRLPRNFEESLRLKFREVRDNCATVPLMREIEVEDQGALFDPDPDELDQAVDLVAKVVDAVEHDTLIPPEFPKGLLSRFNDYGKTLEDGESFEQKPRNWQTAVSYTSQTRDRISELTYQDYEDSIDYCGEAHAADLDGRFAIRLQDGTKVPGNFSQDQESLITEALKEHSTQHLRIKGRAEFWGANGKIKRITAVDSMSLQPAGEVPFDPHARPIWDEISELAASIPDEEWAKVPTDGARNLDHYLYGHPKREE